MGDLKEFLKAYWLVLIMIILFGAIFIFFTFTLPKDYYEVTSPVLINCTSTYIDQCGVAFEGCTNNKTYKCLIMVEYERRDGKWQK